MNTQEQLLDRFRFKKLSLMISFMLVSINFILIFMFGVPIIKLGEPHLTMWGDPALSDYSLELGFFLLFFSGIIIILFRIIENRKYSNLDTWKLNQKILLKKDALITLRKDFIQELSDLEILRKEKMNTDDQLKIVEISRELVISKENEVVKLKEKIEEIKKCPINSFNEYLFGKKIAEEIIWLLKF